jgi:MoaA/NifB/PqqE/SkfB family radical SAM enzyme
MKAEIKPNVDNDRQPLADIIPLAQPFTVYIETTRYCNLRCFYCLISTQDEPDGAMQKMGLKVEHMDPAGFDKIVRDLQAFPKGIKRIVFSGLGEPLMNPRLPAMIRQIADAKIADRIEIITNGLLLTRKKIDELVDSGLTNINISIQGMDSDQYQKACGKAIDFTGFIKNLTYLYERRGSIKIYIKIIDALLQSKESEKDFYAIFSDIADRIYIEHLIVMQQQMDELKNVVDGTKNFYNEEVDFDRKICSPSFYFLQIGCDLDTFPCPVPGLPTSFSLGNAKSQSLVEIWNGERRKRHLVQMLRFEVEKIPECAGCTAKYCITDLKENIDKDAEKLLLRIV